MYKSQRSFYIYSYSIFLYFTSAYCTVRLCPRHLFEHVRIIPSRLILLCTVLMGMVLYTKPPTD